MTGRVRLKGVTGAANPVLHGWLKTELAAILAELPEPTPVVDEQANRAFWESWREGVSVKPTLLSANLPPLRMLLIMDNLAGHHTPELVLWLFRQGILPLYAPLAGSWLNMTESIQRILKRRALDGHYPTTPQHIIAWLEAPARGWNAHPTPFVWAGKRQQRRHRLGGSRAVTKRPLRFRPTTQEYRCA